MCQVFLFLYYSLPLPQPLAHQPYLSMLQIAQASVNDPRRPARRSRGKIMLLDQKRPFTAPGTLARDSDGVNSATDHTDMKPLTSQRQPSFRTDLHTPT